MRTAVAVSDLFCLYAVPHGTVAALRGLSLRVGVGERLVVHGPNGSGKTTLLRVLMGDQQSSAGEVEVAGVDLAGADETTRSELRLRQLGVVEQHAGRTLRPELNVRDNVALQMRLGGVRRRAARARADDALSTARTRPSWRTVPPQRFPVARRSGWQCARRWLTALPCAGR